MRVTRKDLEKNQVELTIELEQAEVLPFLDKTANKLANQVKIPGFRSGKAPFNLIKTQLGDMKIYEAALDSIISHNFFEAVQKENLKTIGQPDIKIVKLAPDNPLIFTATVSLLPTVELGDWKKLSVTKKPIELKDDDINKTLEQLQEMQVKETISTEAAKKGDKAELDFEVYLDKVIIEGGKNIKYPVVLGQGRMIPGFEDQIIGLKTGEGKEFDLKFPEKYFQSNLAGRLANFKVKVINIYHRDLPALDDAFAKAIGFESTEKLKKQLEENIQKDKEFKENQRIESEAIRAVSQQATIGDIPKQLLDNEIHKMIHELEHNIKQQGMDLAGYMKSINKTHDDLHRDFEAQAKDRVRAALVMRTIAEAENIKTTVQEIATEFNKQQEVYKNNPEALKNINHPDYKNYLVNLLTNQKVIKLIRENIIK